VINVKADVSKLTKGLGHLSDQLPYATALALSQVARQARDDVTAKIPSIFAAKGPPTPFTRNAVGYTSANKRNLTATVFVKDAQAKYLVLEETGGTQTPDKGSAFVLPIDAARNAYGNMAKGYLQRMKGRKRNQAFVGTEHNIGGFWLRQAGKLVLLAEFIKKRTYKPKFHYREMVKKSVDANLPAAMTAGIAKALATARTP
jgi:hypothetical protein